MVFQIAVAVYIVHELLLVVFGLEAEQPVGHLLVGGDIQGVVVVSIAVHVVGCHVRIVVSAAPRLVDDADMVAVLVAVSGRHDKAVGSDILRVVQVDVVRTVDGGDIRECRFGVGAGHAGKFL